MPSNQFILCHPLLLLPSIFPRNRVFSNELTLCIRWPEYWSFRISPSNEYSGLISFRMDWFDLLSVQGTLQLMPMVVSYHSFILQFLYFELLFEAPSWCCALIMSVTSNFCLSFCSATLPSFPIHCPRGRYPAASNTAVDILFGALSGLVHVSYGLWPAFKTISKRDLCSSKCYLPHVVKCY